MTELARLVEIVERLRGEGGCEWDRAQTFGSMRPYLLEEVYEVLDAIDAEQPGAAPVARVRDLEEELGDLLFVVLLYARMGHNGPHGGSAGGEHRFDLESIARRIADKMVVRHPHVFGSEDERAALAGRANGIAAWENRKAKLKQREAASGDFSSRLDGVPRALPGLLRAHRQGEKAAAVGFDWSEPRAVLDKVREELDELEEAIEAGRPSDMAHELGDVLQSLASLGRHLGAPPEEALRTANDRFAARFRHMEAQAHRAGQRLEDLDAHALEARWEQAKDALAGPPTVGE